jgi:acyl-CoA synthetase (AMP-forming)/AMP-acid ligase II
VLAGCRERLAYFKVPAELVEIDEIPRTGSGKVLRYRLQGWLLGRGTAHHDVTKRS